MSLIGQKRRPGDGELLVKLAVSDEGAATAEPLAADRAIRAAFSSSVRDLPVEGDEWDISQLLFEGQPVQRQTVVAWLNIAYMQTVDESFEQQTSCEPPHSMTALSQLLAFADAVGSSKALLRVCLSQLDELSASVSIPAPERQPADAEQWEVGINTICLWSVWSDEPHVLATELHNLNGAKTVLMISSEQRAVIAQQVAQQTEQLLYLAHKLQLPALQQKLHAFLRNSTIDTDFLLFGYMGRVLTDRVLEAAADKQQLRDLVINSIMTERCGLNSSEHMHAAQVLEPLNLTPQQRQSLRFNAELKHDAFGYSRGSTVSVQLNLFGREPCISINDATYTAQLVVGTFAWDQTSMEALMGPPPAAVEHEPQ